MHDPPLTGPEPSAALADAQTKVLDYSISTLAQHSEPNAVKQSRTWRLLATLRRNSGDLAGALRALEAAAALSDDAPTVHLRVLVAIDTDDAEAIGDALLAAAQHESTTADRLASFCRAASSENNDFKFVFLCRRYLGSRQQQRNCSNKKTHPQHKLNTTSRFKEVVTGVARATWKALVAAETSEANTGGSGLDLGSRVSYALLYLEALETFADLELDDPQATFQAAAEMVIAGRGSQGPGVTAANPGEDPTAPLARLCHRAWHIMDSAFRLGHLDGALEWCSLCISVIEPSETAAWSMTHAQAAVIYLEVGEHEKALVSARVAVGSAGGTPDHPQLALARPILLRALVLTGAVAEAEEVSRSLVDSVDVDPQVLKILISDAVSAGASAVATACITKLLSVATEATTLTEVFSYAVATLTSRLQTLGPEGNRADLDQISGDLATLLRRGLAVDLLAALDVAAVERAAKGALLGAYLMLPADVPVVAPPAASHGSDTLSHSGVDRRAAAASFLELARCYAQSRPGAESCSRVDAEAALLTATLHLLTARAAAGAGDDAAAKASHAAMAEGLEALQRDHSTYCMFCCCSCG